MRRYGRRLNSESGLATTGGGVYNFVSLYNNSTIGHILRVLNVWGRVNSNTDICCFLVQGSNGSFQSNGLANFAGEQQMAGQIFLGFDANAPLNGLFVQSYGNAPPYGSLIPLFYVRPGFSLIAKADTTGNYIGVSFLWEDLDMDMLSPHELQ